MAGLGYLMPYRCHRGSRRGCGSWRRACRRRFARREGFLRRRTRAGRAARRGILRPGISVGLVRFRCGRGVHHSVLGASCCRLADCVLTRTATSASATASAATPATTLTTLTTLRLRMGAVGRCRRCMRSGGGLLGVGLCRSALGLAVTVTRASLGVVPAPRVRAAALALRAAASFTSATLVALVPSSVTWALEVMMWAAARRRFGLRLGLGGGLLDRRREQPLQA